ncbi:MAG: nitroreductase family protein [Proteobacteria bacterium]|nr:nitroreductase family protein [Pseudomonadota bacterium]
MNNPVLETILRRRSVRHFTEERLSEEDLNSILEAGRWAPSGHNHQPWRFVVVESSEKKDALAELTRYGKPIQAGAACVVVFLDTDVCYDRVKDAQSAGAVLQNMLLAAEALGYGAVWLGEILKNQDKVRSLFDLPESMDLQAVVALGRPKHRNQTSERRPLEELVLGRY